MLEYKYTRTIEVLSELLTDIESLPSSEEKRNLQIVYHGMRNLVIDKLDGLKDERLFENGGEFEQRKSPLEATSFSDCPCCFLDSNCKCNG